MNTIKALKGIALGALVCTGTAFAAEATMGGQIPLTSSVIIYPERQLDFSATGTDIKMAEIVLTNNSPGVNVSISFDQTAVAFATTGGTSNILTDLALESLGSVGWGNDLLDDGVGAGANPVDIVSTADDIAQGVTCATGTNIDITSAVNVSGGLSGCVDNDGATPGDYVIGQVIGLNDGADAFAAQTTPTVNASVEVVGSWGSGQTIQGDALMAGTYSAVMTVTMESNY
ncbi:MAG: hypothetical protein OCD01_15810 [Fibrobacterales bacterium]